MGSKANASQIVSFLQNAKQLIASGKYDFVPRKKCLNSLSSHGLTVADAKNEIISLTTSDYYKGPKSDFDTSKPGDIWEFKKSICGCKFYIKLKIINTSSGDQLKCLGFHEDDFS